MIPVETVCLDPVSVEGTYSGLYGHLAKSPLWGTLTFKQGSTVKATTSREFDRLNRLLVMTTTPGIGAGWSSRYAYNTANQRTRRTDFEGSYWVYEYDALGQVISGKRFWADGSPVAGQQFEYAYDDIGNPTSSKEGGDASGLNLRSVGYTRNDVNQDTWDGENRILSMQSPTTLAAANRRKVSWEYDPAGRRIRQTTAGWNGSNSTWTNATDIRLVYDGWACIAELNATNNALIQSYVWGLDLSGTPTGAGGVGGLLWVRPNGGAAHFAAYDGNGNVIGLVDGTTGLESARYEYDTFGNTIRLTGTGTIAKENKYRFSTKRIEPESGLVLYEYRPYSTFLGRWPNRDPIGEKGGANRYRFGGDPGTIDPLGLFTLHYMDYPKWGIASEYLWVGHYVTFDATDAAALTRSSGSGPATFGGTMLLNHRISATVTDCKTGVTLSNQGDDVYFANRFSLWADGRLAGADYDEPFNDGQNHMYFQSAFVQMGTVFRNSPGYARGASGSGAGLPTKGKLSSVVEIRIISSGAYAVEQDAFNTVTPGWRQGDIHSHELGGHYYGYTSGMVPMSWSVSPTLSTTVTVNFEWDNCCGSKWRYSVSPTAEAGYQRISNVGKAWDVVNLIKNPSSNNW